MDKNTDHGISELSINKEKQSIKLIQLLKMFETNKKENYGNIF